MEESYDDALVHMDRTLSLLLLMVPQPVHRRIYIGDKESIAYRFEEQTIHQAIVQKLVRIISGLRAARILVEHGLVQEQASLHRMLDEFNEDIMFLSLAIIYDDISELHERYLAAFYEEEFDAKTAMSSTQKRPMIPRRKIRYYLDSKISDDKLGGGPEAARTVSKMYSGYLHGASDQIMDIYFGDPPVFHTNGILGTSRHREYRDDLWNYMYRGLLSFGLTLKAFGREAEFEENRRIAREFGRNLGRDYGLYGSPWRG